jgi:hypothetical protein
VSTCPTPNPHLQALLSTLDQISERTKAQRAALGIAPATFERVRLLVDDVKRDLKRTPINSDTAPLRSSVVKLAAVLEVMLDQRDRELGPKEEE